MLEDERQAGYARCVGKGELTPHEALGRAIRVAREERGLRRADLAEEAGISYTHLAEIENGKKNPSPSALRAVAAALEVRPFELMALAEALGEERGSITRAAIRERVTREPPAFLEPPGRVEAEMRMYPSAAMAREPADRMSLLDLLLALAKDLPPEDLQHLLDLARRLRQH
jgi:transcriptional regulator with XRE-family HTH domain